MALDTVSTTYDYIHERSMEDREAFWLEASSVIDWEVPPGPKVLDDEAPPFYSGSRAPGSTPATTHSTATSKPAEGSRRPSSGTVL